MNELEEIKNRVDIVELVGGYVQLKKAGRNYKGLCPFHSEKTPSFMVSPEKQIWHCFGACSEGGDIFSFIQKVEGLSFGEAVQKLAEQTGVKLKNQSYEKSETKTQLYSANEIAAGYYQEVLVSDSGKIAQDYLIKNRKLKAETIKLFRLGYAPPKGSNLQTELKNNKIETDAALNSGLFNKKEDGLRDFFWGRLMFPISDAGGRVIAFSARALDDSLPKYINTPETPIYSKSNTLYGLSLAKESIRKLDYAIIAEGMMDVIASVQAGVKNIVAPGGTALTENQLRLISRFTKNLKLAFDLDFAGNEATRRAIELALRMGFNLKVITLPSGKDPGDLAIARPKEWKKAVFESKYVIDYLFDEAFRRHNKKDALGRKYIAKELLPVLKRISDEIEKDTYIKRLANELLVEESSIRSALASLSLPKEKRVQIKEIKRETNNSLELERGFLGLLALCPTNLDFVESILAADDFENQEPGNYYEKMLKYYQKTGDFSESKFLSSLNKGEGEAFKHYILSAEANFSDLDDIGKDDEIFFSAKRIKRLALAKKEEALSKLIASYEKSKNHQGVQKALIELNKIHEEQRRVT